MVKCYIKDIIKNLTIKSLARTLADDIFVSGNPVKASLFSRGLIICIMLLLVGVGSANAAIITWDGSSSVNWNTTTNWSTNTVPTINDDVIIPNNFNVTIDAAAVCKSLTINGGNQSNTITIGSTNSLTVVGTVTINAGTQSGDNKVIDVGTGSFTCGSINIGNTGNNNRYSRVSVSSGSINVLGDITMGGSATRNQIVFTSNGTLNIDGTMSGGGLTPSIGTVNYTGADQTVGNYNYYNLTLSNSGTKTLQAGTTTIGGSLVLSGTCTATLVADLTIAANLNIGNGTTLDLSAFTANRTAAGGGTHTVAGTMILRGTTGGRTGSNFPASFSTVTLTGGTVVFAATTGSQTIPAFTFSDLSLSNSSGATLSGAVSVAGTLTLVNGILTTTGNLLSITNTASTAISGGSATAYIKGPVVWTLPKSEFSGLTYNFPVGDTGYLPFSLVTPTTAAGPVTATVQAFSASSAGSAGTGLSSISTSEYWSLATSGLTSSKFSLGRGTGVSPYNTICTSTTKGGVYTSKNGIADVYSINNSDLLALSSTSNYFVLGESIVAQTAVSTSALNGFTYVLDKGPSAEQSFTVSGTDLTSDIVITAGAHYEISTSSGSGFQSSLTIPRSGATVLDTRVFVRLKTGLPVANYNESISIATTGTASKIISCVGAVTQTAPTITATGAYCNGAINLNATGASSLSNLYWTGPNSYYSTSPSNTITTTSAAYSGTYTVNGTVLSAVNLVTNGDFEQGNTGFTSAYIYRDSTYVNSNDPNGTGTKYYGALYNEANYTVVANPRNVHINFSPCPDHTAAGTKQMVINGAGAASVTVWSQTVPVQSNTYYQFTYWLQSVNGISPSQLQLFINGVAVGPIYTAQTTTCMSTEYYYNWNSGGATTAVLSLVNQNTSTGGNDFALDDIVFQSGYQVSSSVNVTVGTVTPSVAISASAISVPSGTPVTLTAVPTNGGATPVYQWYVNDVVAGTNSPTYTYVPLNNDVVKCVLTSTATSCSASQQVTSNLISLTVNARANYWKGTTSTEWNIASNWTDHVPLEGEDVYFASITNGYTSNAVVNDLYVAGEKIIGKLITRNTGSYKVVIPAGTRLVVNDTILTNGSVDNIHIKSSPSLSNGVLIFHNKAKNSVKATVEMYSKASITTDVNNKKHYNWQYFGIPITAMKASPVLDGAYVRDWHEDVPDSITHWQSLTNQSDMVPFYGYELCQANPKTYTFYGNLVNSDFYAGPENYKPGVVAPGKLPFTSNGWKFSGQTVFANPYTAPIDIKKLQLGYGTDNGIYQYNTGSISDWTSGGAGGAVMDDNIVSAGQYIVSTVMTAGSSNGTIPRYVPSMGNMLIRATGDLSTATFGIVYKDVVASVSSAKQRITGIDQAGDMIVSRVQVAGNSGKDCAWLFTDPTCVRTYDNGWDGRKMLGSALSPQIYAVESDGNYQINAVNDINNTEFAFQAGSDIEYTLTFTHNNVKKYYPGVYLVDKLENKIVDVTESGSQYKFLAVSTPNPVNRFQIVTRYYQKDAPDETSDIKIFSSKGMIFVHNFGKHNGNALIFDISGHFVTKVPFSANGITILNSGIVPGAYVAKCLTETDKVTKRIIVR